MAAEAQRAPRVVREPMIALSVHPRLSATDPRDAINQLMLRLDRIRAAFSVATDLLTDAQEAGKPNHDLEKGWMLVLLGNEDLSGFEDSLQALHDALPSEVVA